MDISKIKNNIITKPIEASFIKGIASDIDNILSIDVPDKDLVNQSIISGKNTIKAAPIIEPLIDPSPPIIIIARNEIDN